jgi:hypothetical protein
MLRFVAAPYKDTWFKMQTCMQTIPYNNIMNENIHLRLKKATW